MFLIEFGLWVSENTFMDPHEVHGPQVNNPCITH